MSEDLYADLPDEHDEGTPGDNEPGWLTTIRKKAREHDKLAKQLEQQKLQLAMYQADLDVTNPTFELFRDAYKGDATPEAIRDAAGKYNLVKSQQQQPAQEVKPPSTEEPPDPTQQQTVEDPTALAELRRKDAEAALIRAREISGQAKSDDDKPPVDFSKAKTADEFFRMYEQDGGIVNWS